jgi:CubicO group peptidase (beta-lactamase class C family)
MLNYAALDAVLEEIVARWGIPGLGVGIVEGDEILYARGFGVQSLDTGAPVTPESVFCVASITKCFVATAMMQLVEQGRLDLDAPLVDYLPDFRLDDARCTRITLRQMLSHTSGMPDFDESEYDVLVAHPEYDDGAPERLVRSLKDRKMVAAPGERFHYSNIAYNVLGYLISRLSGETFEAYMQAHVLRPAGMLDSTLTPADVPPSRLAAPHLRTPHMRVNPIYPYHRADAPASYLHSTVVDMCHWGTTCLKRGTYAGQYLLSPASYETMWTPVAEWGYPPLYEHTGLGWTLGHFEGVRTVSHGGMGFGWTDFLTILPEKNRAAIILCNEESSARSRTIRAALHTMLEMPPQVGAVSWMIPINQALIEGGIQAAYDCYERLKDSRSDAYFFDADELITLVYQLVSVGQIELAMDVLRLNLHVFPEHVDSYLCLANLCLTNGNVGQAEEALSNALALQPDNPAIQDQLQKLRK